jgi:chemotaxis protein MotB
MARRFKKVEGGHGHHGGAWKVAYADFVTAMMALFMVLWLLASTDAQSRKEISNYFRTGILPEGDLSMKSAAQIKPSVIEESGTPQTETGVDHRMILEAKADAAKQISEKLGRLAAIDPKLAQVIENVHIQQTPEGIIIDTVDEDEGLLFEMSSPKLSEQMQRFLRAFAPVLVAVNHKIEINGHTDARPFAAGSRLSNWDLSYMRASAAREILEASGLPAETVVGVFARGSTQLYVPSAPYAAQNRRLTFLIKIASSGDSVQKRGSVETVK